MRSEGKHLDVFCLPCGYLGELIMRLAAAGFKVRTQGRCRDPTEVGKCPLTNGQPALEAGAPVAGIDAARLLVAALAGRRTNQGWSIVHA